MNKARVSALVVTATLATSPTAQALPALGRVTQSGGFSGVPHRLTYQGLAGGERMEIFIDGYEVVFRDTGGGTILFNNTGCRSGGASIVRCPHNGDAVILDVDAGLGDDIVDSSGWPGAVSLGGGDGADVLTAGPGPDVLTGGAGPDRLSGGEGDDRLDGTDPLIDAVDLLDCGAGLDSASWTSRDIAISCETAF
jgi:hypothetical protein